MIVQCQNCKTKLRLNEKHLAGRTEVKVRCTKCGGIFTARIQELDDVAPIPLDSDPASQATLASTGTKPSMPLDKTVALSVTDGPLKGKIFHVTNPRIIFGREGSDIIIDDLEVSRKHCGLEVHGSTATLVDLGSRNGIYIGEKRVESCEIEHLSEFRIGQNTFMLTVTTKT
ncbi:MAG: FHA domain-containing protein [Terriglobia bacterium]